MRRFTNMQVLFASTLLVGAFVFSTGAVAASPNDYRAGMPGLLQDVKTWAGDVEMTTAAAITKPELACGAAMTDLVLRGHSIADDLAGSGQNVPGALAASHNELTATVVRMTGAVEQACGNSAGAAQAVQADKSAQSRAMFRISNFVNGGFGQGGSR
jgi:hypothetical protein